MINPEELKAEIIRLATQYPKARYEMSPCFYTKGEVTNCGLTGCIVGIAIGNLYPHLIPMLGFYDQRLKDNIQKGKSEDVSITTILTDLGIEFCDTISFIDSMQKLQDNVFSWGKCLIEANYL